MVRFKLVTMVSLCYMYFTTGFPSGSDSEESACRAGDMGSIPGLGRSPGEGNGIPLQYSCLGNPMDRGAWWAAVHGVTNSQTWLSNFTFTFLHWRRKWQPTPVFLPWDSQGWGSLVGCVYGVAQSQTRLKWLSSSSSHEVDNCPVL